MELSWRSNEVHVFGSIWNLRLVASLIKSLSGYLLIREAPREYEIAISFESIWALAVDGNLHWYYLGGQDEVPVFDSILNLRLVASLGVISSPCVFFSQHFLLFGVAQSLYGNFRRGGKS